MKKLLQSCRLKLTFGQIMFVLWLLSFFGCFWFLTIKTTCSFILALLMAIVSPVVALLAILFIIIIGITLYELMIE